MARILVIDDEPGIRSGVREILALEGHDVDAAECGAAALGLFEARDYDIAFIDYRLPDVDGLTLLQSIRKGAPRAMTCMITAYANIETAIAATRQGIDFFLPKPFSADDLLGVVETLLRHKALRDETERLRAAHEVSLKALASEKSQTHSLVSSLRDGVLVINREGEVALANRAMEELLGAEPGSLLRRRADDALGHGPLSPALSALDRGAPAPAAFEADLDSRRLFVTVCGFFDDGGSRLGQIVTAVDISVVRRLALEKARFTRTLVHELRAPLGTVKSIIEVVRDRSLGEDLEKYEPFLARAEERIDGLGELISDLLSLSRIDHEGAASTPCAPLDVVPVAAEAVDLFRERAAAVPLSLTFEAVGELPSPAIEAEDLKTILTNLVGNAIKYNRPGGSVAVRARPAQGGIEFAVTDTGLGIDASNLAKLGDEFFREKRAETRDIEGNGLGLAIVKRLVERAGGRLGVSSELGRGSEFRVTLPA